MSDNPYAGEQLSLFDAPESSKREESHERWYYVTKDNNDKMLVLDDKGRHVFVDHDLQYVKPFFIRNPHRAKSLAQSLGAVARVYPYDIHWQFKGGE